jgi:hypothetical protein
MVARCSGFVLPSPLLPTRTVKRSLYGRDPEVTPQAKALTWDEAHRIATGIARLPELMAGRSLNQGRPSIIWACVRSEVAAEARHPYAAV